MIWIITGPPASGKSTHVRQHARVGDITIDYDELAATLSVAADQHSHPPHVRSVVAKARAAAIDQAIATAGGDHDVYIIHSTPSAAQLDRYKAAGAEVVVIDPGRDVVVARCKRERPWQMAQAAKLWYQNRTSRQETHWSRPNW